MKGQFDLNSLAGVFSNSLASEMGLQEFLISILFSTFFGLFYFFIYRVYFKGEDQIESSLNKSLILISPAVTSIFWAIQYSLPLSLGLLGALSFIRYRTPLKRSEDVAFILLVIASSLGCAVYRFGFVLILALVALIIALAKRYGPWQGGFFAKKVVSILVSMNKEADKNTLETIKSVIERDRIRITLNNVTAGDSGIDYYVRVSGFKMLRDAESAVHKLQEKLNPRRLEIFYEG